MVLGLAATVSADEEFLTSGDWTYRVVRGTAMLITYNGTDTEVTVPATIDGIPVSDLGIGLGGTAFEAVADTMTSVTIEDGITILNAGVFKGCTALTEVSIPSSVTYIGSVAFQDCTALKEIELKEGLTSVGMYTFLNTGLTSVLIPSTVNDIGNYAFGWNGTTSDYDSIDGFTIYAYTGTAGHKYAESAYFINFVDLGGNYNNTGRCGDALRWEFTAATGTLRIYGPGGDMYDYDEDEIPWLIHKPYITNVVIESGVEICYCAFQDCTNLTSVTMTDSVVDIHGAAFMNTPKLTSLRLPANLEYIGSHVFCDSGLTSIKLPDSLRDIGPEAFRNTALTSIVIPDSVIGISTGAFRSCTKLTNVKLPAGLDSLSGQTFMDCTSLRTITLPETIQYIGHEEFSGSALTSIEIPVSTTFIEDTAFANCAKLTTVTFLGNAPEFRSGSFQNTTTTCLYPYGNPTWTEEVMQSYGGNVTWKAYDPELFVDVAMDEFYYNSVAWAVDNGITSGVNATHFAPNDSCLRSQVVTFLWRAAGKPVVEFENPFTDVKPTDYYYDAVLWAVSEGITQGVKADRFGPNEKCNRSQVVTFLWRAAGEPVVRAENPFADVKPTDYYYDAVLWAARNSITTGTNPTTFAPFEVCNRSQVVTFLYRADNIPQAQTYTFELLTNDPSEETGFVEVEGAEFAAGESVIFYAEPWYGYLVEFTVQPEGLTPELYYLGGNYYELIMPECDVTLTAHFVPATGSYQYIELNAANCLAMVNCLADEDGNDVAKPGEYVQILVIPDEGFSLADATFTAANGEMVDWWYLGSVEDGSDTIHVLEMVMPGSDVDITITCTPGTAPAAAEVRVPVSIG